MPRLSTVGDLKEYLDQYDDESELAVAYQPSYPLRAYVANVVSSSEIAEGYDDEDPNANEEEVVWIAIEQAHDPYGVPREVWEG